MEHIKKDMMVFLNIVVWVVICRIMKKQLLQFNNNKRVR
jgi:hypothetical protein